jgi:hypothetical protein
VMFAETANSGEEFRRPGGVSCGRTKGRWEREARASYSHGLMAITREKLVGGLLRRVSVSREKRGNGGEDGADGWGPPGSEGERGRGIPVRERR